MSDFEKPAWVRLFPSDFMAGSAFMPGRQKCIYSFLLILQADQGCIRLSANELSEFLQVPIEDVEAVLDNKFDFNVDINAHINARMKNEFDRAGGILARKKRGAEKARSRKNLAEEPEPEPEPEPDSDIKVDIKVDIKKDDLEPIWKAFPSKSRNRSSRAKLAAQWKRVPAKERPSLDDLEKSVLAWASSEDWQKDGGQFAPAAERFIRDRKWQDLPETTVAEQASEKRKLTSSDVGI